MSIWKPLTDVQWMNIVNHEQAYWDMSKDEAVHLAVKKTEAKLKEINGDPADSRIESLENALKAAKQYVIQTDDYGRSYSDDVLKIINEALGEQQ